MSVSVFTMSRLLLLSIVQPIGMLNSKSKATDMVRRNPAVD